MVLMEKDGMIRWIGDGGSDGSRGNPFSEPKKKLRKAQLCLFCAHPINATRRYHFEN
jgi:hypothetical protein